MPKKKNKTRLYEIFNLQKGASGSHFPMCDIHKDKYSVDGCIVQKIADEALDQCVQCYEEVVNDGYIDNGNS